jgi:hypothetical protein
MWCGRLLSYLGSLSNACQPLYLNEMRLGSIALGGDETSPRAAAGCRTGLPVEWFEMDSFDGGHVASRWNEKFMGRLLARKTESYMPPSPKLFSRLWLRWTIDMVK